MTPHAIEPFYVMEILALAQALEGEGRDICHLEIGEPGMPPAPRAIAAVRDGIGQPHRYTAAKGQPALRARLAGYYAERHGVAVDPERIIVTMGSSSGFILAFLSAFAPGSRIAVTRPGYPAYLNILAALNLVPVEIGLDAAKGWRLSARDVAEAHAETPFDGLLFASPANPTGAVIGKEELAEILGTCARLGVLAISDEIYHGLDHTGTTASALEIGDEAIVVNSFSKYYCMTGWRVGWLVMPQTLVRRAEMMAQSLFISAASVSQAVALAALDERAYYDEQRAAYAANRTLLIDGLAKLGFVATGDAEGAFYAYVDASAFTDDSMAFSKRLLAEAGVAAAPGVDFDRRDGRRFMRFSYAGDRDTIVKALEKMAGFLSARPFPSSR